MAGPRTSEIARMRIDAGARCKAFGLSSEVTVEPVTANGATAEWTSTPDADRSGAVLYLHGGGYVICPLDRHRHLAAEVALSPRIWPETIHVWPLCFPMLSAGRRAIAAGGSFVRGAITGG